MAFPFSVEDRITVPLSSPEKAQEVAAGIERWLEKSNAHKIHWENDVLHFTGNYNIWWYRGHRPFHGMGSCALRFEDHPEEVVIEYTLSFRLIPYLVLVLISCLPAIFTGGVHMYTLLFLPIAALIHGGIWFLARFDFRSALRIAATRGMADAAERELHALQTS